MRRSTDKALVDRQRTQDESADEPLRLGEFVDFIAPGLSRLSKPPLWPPDVFGICGAVLYRSGAYTRVVDRWPPASGSDWNSEILKIAKRWRSVSDLPKIPPSDHLIFPPL